MARQVAMVSVFNIVYKIILESNVSRLEGNFKDGGPLFLVWDGSICRLDPSPDKNANIVALFYPQGRGVVVVKMSNTFSFRVGDYLCAKCRNGDVVYVGIAPYKIIYKNKWLARFIAIITVVVLIVAGLVIGFRKSGLGVMVKSSVKKNDVEIGKFIEEVKSQKLHSDGD